MTDGVIAAIDPGEGHVRVVVARYRGGMVRVLAQAEAEGKGLQRGRVTDPEAAVEAIHGVLRGAERQLGYPLYTAVLCVPGPAVFTLNGQAAIEPSGLRRSVSERDVHRVLGRARPRLAEGRHHLLHLLPMRYTLDGVLYEDRPLRVRGRELTASTCALVTELAPTRHLIDVVEAAGVKVTDLVAVPLASSLALLSEAEQRMGALLLEIGVHSSTLAIVQRGCFQYATTVPLGGYQLTSDLAVGLSIPWETAERIKIAHGSVYLDGPPGAPLTVQDDQGGKVSIARQDIVALLRDRAAEILAITYRRVEAAGWERLPPAGLVLAGGSARLGGLERLARELLQVPARVGTPRGLAALPPSAQDPAWAAVAGALLWKALTVSGDRRPLAATSGPQGSLSQRIGDWASRLFEYDSRAPALATEAETVGSSPAEGTPSRARGHRTEE